jgi:hypothetical protein
MSLLPEPNHIEKAAEHQLGSILGLTNDKEHELTGLEWARAALYWRVIKAGYFVPAMPYKFERLLRSKSVRLNAEKLFDRTTLEEAIDLLDAKGGKDASQAT